MTSQRPTLGTRADQPPCEPPAVWCCSAYYRSQPKMCRSDEFSHGELSSRLSTSDLS